MRAIKMRMVRLQKLFQLHSAGVLDDWELDNYSHLQIRMVCELIALACLAAHNEMPVDLHPKLIH
jgi:hypothetical protein